MAQDSVKVSLEIATQAAEIALKNLKKTTEETDSFWNIFKGNFAAGLALDSLKGAFGAVTGFVSSVVEESSKAQQSVQNMNVALQNAGIYSEATSLHFQALADSIELTTAYAGDSVESSVSMLAALTKLDKDGITAATNAAVDLAATLNVDLGTASDMIVKAVNGNVTAFGKLGIEIQKGRTDSENLANTLQALAGQQGAAVKQADTFAGATAKLSNQQGKLLETVGNLITQNPVVTAGINTLTESMVSLSTFVQDNEENITDLATALAASVVIVGTAGAAWVTYSTLTGGATIALAALSTAASAAWAAITGPVGIAVGAIVAVGAAVFAAIKYWDEIKIATAEATAAILEFAAAGAGLVSSDTEAKLKAEAQAFRDKADAVRIAQAAEIEAENARKAAQGQETTDDVAAAAKKRAEELEQLREYYAEKAAMKTEHDANLVLAESDLNLQLQDLKAQHETAMFEISGEYDGKALAKQLEGEQARLLARQQFEREQLQATIDAQKAKALLIQDDQQREKALREAGYKAELAQVQLANKQSIEQTKQKNKTEEMLDRQRVNDKRQTFSTIVGLQSSSNKELAAVGKAFALYDIGVQTAQGIMKAWGLGPIIGPPAAALVAAAGMTQAAAVSGLNFATGGIVPGTSYTGDKVAANVNSREMILNMGQQKRLFDIANGGGEGGSLTNQLLAELIAAVKAGASIQIDGREILSVVRDGLAEGRTI